ncbi:MAG TPA: 16S rRNA (uracil(1498)-N(3))-methyltransferase [Candidatus Cybelea sp.]|nr:16S rRNA (uracil(1498)-N(3))-methyltransferase [Candidatus Cybelea sp.]
MLRDKPRHRLYVAADLAQGAAVPLDAAQAHYLGTVLRYIAGDEVAVFNGRDGEWQAIISGIGRKSATLTLGSCLRNQSAEPDLWLCFAPIKHARVDLVAEKAGELGVSVLQPVLTRRTNAARVNVERLAANAREAAEQCERLTVPEVRAPVRLDALLSAWPADRRLLFCDEAGGRPIADALAAEQPRGAASPWAVLVGPEGGFDDGERAMLRANAAALPVSLGPRLLRADTAAIAALALWQAHLGDWRAGH